MDSSRYIILSYTAYIDKGQKENALEGLESHEFQMSFFFVCF